MSYREMADQCCDSCRKLHGEGPWCGRCGAERPGSMTAGGWFTDDLCVDCERRSEAEHVDGSAQ